MKLHIACGQRKQPGFKGVDNKPGPGIDYVLDLEKYPWEPFKDNSIEEVYCVNYFESVSDVTKFMDEIWRICEDDAKLTIVCSYYTSMQAWQDPTFKRAISENTFLYFDKDWRAANKLDHYPIKSNFKNEKILVFFNSPWDKKSEESRQFAKKHYWNVVGNLVAELRVEKY